MRRGSRLGAPYRGGEQFQLHDHQLHARRARVRIPGQARLHHPVHRGAPRRRRGRLGDVGCERGWSIALECAASGEHLKQNGAEGKNIAAGVCSAAEQKFGRGVGSDGHGWFGSWRQQFEPGAGQDEIRRCHRAMNVSRVVQAAQVLGQNHRQAKRFGDGQTALFETLCKGSDVRHLSLFCQLPRFVSNKSA